jgi:hypothetical protein
MISGQRENTVSELSEAMDRIKSWKYWRKMGQCTESQELKDACLFAVRIEQLEDKLKAAERHIWRFGGGTNYAYIAQLEAALHAVLDESTTWPDVIKLARSALHQRPAERHT